MIDVECSGFGPRVPSHVSLPIRPTQLARATATMCGYAPELDSLRRLVRQGAIALEVLTHVALLKNGNGRNLAVVGNRGMERSDLAALSHRLGVGMARVIAEQSPFLLSRFYYVDGLLGASAHRPAGIAVPRPLATTKSVADMIAADQHGNWSVIEAKGRRTERASSALLEKAKKQSQAIDLEDAKGKPLPVAMRIGSVAALDGVPITVRFADPPDGVAEVAYRLEPRRLLWNYYEPVRDLVEVYGKRLLAISGEPDFIFGPLPGTAIGLVVHRRLLEGVSGPDALLDASHAVTQEMIELNRERVDSEFDVGLDGLGIFVTDDQLAPLIPE
jgi:hypothetical protein